MYDRAVPSQMKIVHRLSVVVIINLVLVLGFDIAKREDG